MIVEDNEALGFILQVMLESRGYDVRKASDGAVGYFNYLRFRPDLVITDIEMPKENGLELMRHIRMHDPRIRTIYMSVDLDQFRSVLEEEKNRYRVDVLKKPFSRIELMRLIVKGEEHGDY